MGRVRTADKENGGRGERPAAWGRSSRSCRWWLSRCPPSAVLAKEGVRPFIAPLDAVPLIAARPVPPLGASSVSPHSFTWNDVPVGIHTLRAVATDNEGATNTSTSIVIEVIRAPFFVTPRLSQAVCPGGTATFSVVASGSPPLAYQWRFGTTPIPGASMQDGRRTLVFPLDSTPRRFFRLRIPLPRRGKIPIFHDDVFCAANSHRRKSCPLVFENAARIGLPT